MSMQTQIKLLQELDRAGFNLSERLILDDSVIESVIKKAIGPLANTVQIIRQCFPILSLTKVDGVIKIVLDREYNPNKKSN